MFALCVGMYRACSTWQYGVAGSILGTHRQARRLGFVEGILFHEKVDAPPPSEGWSVLKAHDAHPRFAELLAGRAAVGFYAYRDLRDAVSSYMRSVAALPLPHHLTLFVLAALSLLFASFCID